MWPHLFGIFAYMDAYFNLETEYSKYIEFQSLKLEVNSWEHICPVSEGPLYFVFTIKTFHLSLITTFSGKFQQHRILHII